MSCLLPFLKQFTFDNFKIKYNCTKDENIGNYGYIGILFLRICQIYRRYIGRYFGKNIGMPKIVKNSWKCKKNLIII